jgi:succinate dehydrogenase hydrophobic anchor subunit
MSSRKGFLRLLTLVAAVVLAIFGIVEIWSDFMDYHHLLKVFVTAVLLIFILKMIQKGCKRDQ